MSIYVTTDGEMLDAICYLHYGREDMVETVLRANAGLAAQGPRLSAGHSVFLPPEEPRPVAVQLRLWGSA